jgi:hypothetical protein
MTEETISNKEALDLVSSFRDSLIGKRNPETDRLFCRIEEAIAWLEHDIRMNGEEK